MKEKERSGTAEIYKAEDTSKFNTIYGWIRSDPVARYVPVEQSSHHGELVTTPAPFSVFTLSCFQLATR